MRALLRRFRRGLEPQVALDIVAQVSAALQHCHSRGVAHCDIKPHNVVLAAPFEPGARIQVKVVDFGLATRFDPRAPGGDRVYVCGCTFGYAAPEALREERHDPSRSDMFSVGVLLYMLLCGRPPFVPERGAQDAADHLRAQARGASFSEPAWCDVRPEVTRLVSTLLLEDASLRPSAADVAAFGR